MAENIFQTASCITRYPGNPILSPCDVPYDATLVFNPAVVKFQGRYVMVTRNDMGNIVDGCSEAFYMGLAFSDDGVHWTPEPELINVDPSHPLHFISDPRATVVDGRFYLTFATFPRMRGTCGGVAVTDDLKNWEVLSVSAPDNRNMVIFPERIDGKLWRLERPFAAAGRPGDRFDTWISASPDGRYWGETQLFMTCDQVPWCNEKIGPGGPPIKTDKGWLSFFHAVDIDPSRKWGWEKTWTKRYSAGLMLIDLEDPTRIIGMCKTPVLVPEESYETDGYRSNVIFPTAMILEDDGEVKIYYGAADTVIGLATARVDDLIALCEPV
jgi:beta-1,4-mannooligosaccharide/beta-1,4-mannosyl-N-acetylglucosamine phosphorylase